MYIWTGCKLPEDFEYALRQRCLQSNEIPGLDASGFSLPQHISLKQSFDTNADIGPIMDAIEALLRQERPFYVNPSVIEQQYHCLWVSFEENEVLSRLHSRLDTLLSDRFGIPQHLYDRYFQFHSTLFLGEPENLQQMRVILSDFQLPQQLKVDTFLLGVSETGKSGSYRVVRTVKV